MFDSVPDNLPVVNSSIDNNGQEVTPLANEPVRPAADLYDSVPLDQETKIRHKWQKWPLWLIIILLAIAGGWIGWFGVVPFSGYVVYTPPWQLSADKVAQYVVNDLLKSEHVSFSAVLSADKFKAVIDDRLPELTNVSADLDGEVNFLTPFDGQIDLKASHNGQSQSQLNYLTISGQAYLTGQSDWEPYKTVFSTARSAQVVLPKQNSQPVLSFADIKDIYRDYKFLIASGLERSTVDGQDYALVTLTADADKYQGFVQAVREKNEMGLPYASNLDMIFSPATTIKAAIRLSDKTFRSAFIEGTHNRLGRYNLSIVIKSLDKNVLSLIAPENIITINSALEGPQSLLGNETVPLALQLLINQQPDNIKRLIGTNINLPIDLPTDYNLDSDKDGLVDVIEILIGTLANKADSDADGYGDAQEIAHGYNPLGEGKLVFPDEKNNQPTSTAP